MTGYILLLRGTLSFTGGTIEESDFFFFPLFFSSSAFLPRPPSRASKVSIKSIERESGYAKRREGKPLMRTKQGSFVEPRSLAFFVMNC